MRRLGARDGLSLIEVIISMAILGIIVVVFLSVFTSGVTGIFSAGHKSRAEYIAQQEMEKALHMATRTNISGSEWSITAQEVSDFTIFFSGTNIVVSGTKLDLTYDDGKRNVKLTSFLPHD